MHRTPGWSLALVGFALSTGTPVSPPLAGAAVLVVDTLDDFADPPFDSGAACGAGSAADLPGADGRVSLREAMAAANAGPDAATVTFAPGLAGGTVTIAFDGVDAGSEPDPLPLLCAGRITIDGDLDGDGTPDVTLDGAAFAASASPGLGIRSDRNAIRGLRLRFFPVGVELRAGDGAAPVVTGNVVEDNVMELVGGGVRIVAGPQGESAVESTRVANNVVDRCTGDGIRLLTTGSRTRIAGTAIDGNVVRGCGQGVFVTSEGSDARIAATAVRRNRIEQSASPSIHVIGGNRNADRNVVDGLEIAGNVVLAGRNAAIRVIAGQDHSSDNRVAAAIAGNALDLNFFIGILAFAGEGAFSGVEGTSSRNHLDLVVEDNVVTRQLGIGIAVSGAAGSPDGRPGGIADENRTIARVARNVVLDSILEGMALNAAGTGAASRNHVTVEARDNVVCRNGLVRAEGGYLGGANPGNRGSGNLLDGVLAGNVATLILVLDGTPGNEARLDVSGNRPCALLP